MFVFSAKPVGFCVGVVLPHPSKVPMLLSGLKYVTFKEGAVHVPVTEHIEVSLRRAVGFGRSLLLAFTSDDRSS
jgi:hypothetical protein